VISAFRREVD